MCILEYLCQLYWAHMHCAIQQTFIFVTFQFFSKIAGLYYIVQSLAIHCGSTLKKKKKRKYSKIFKDFLFAVLLFLISERQFEHSSWDFIIKELYLLIYICLCNAHTVTNAIFLNSRKHFFSGCAACIWS